MQLKLIRQTLDKKQIGFYPQTKTGSYYDWLAQFPKGTIRFDKVLPETNFYLDLDNRAKFTDILDRSAITFGLVVNGEVKSILNHYKLPTNSTFNKIKVRQNGIYHEYYWLNFYVDLHEQIDFEKSTFLLYYPLKDEVKKELFFCGKEDFIKNINSYAPYIVIPKQVILLEGELKYDIVYDNVFHNGIYISNTLENAFIENEIDGYDIFDDKHLFMSNFL